MKVCLDRYQLSDHEKQEIKALLVDFGDDLSLEQLWSLIDRVWLSSGCGDVPLQQECLDRFYRHPVWTLNGLFIEQDLDSLSHRRSFADVLSCFTPASVLDVGGGFGTLARLISDALPIARVDILEPYPTACMKALISSYPKIDFTDQFKCNHYDALVCTDVLEHVQDPLLLLRRMVSSVKLGGHLLIANCFEPAVLCHLPSTFHLRFTFDDFCERLGLKKVHCGSLPYGSLFQRKESSSLPLWRMRKLESRSKKLYPLRSFSARLKLFQRVSAFKKYL